MSKPTLFIGSSVEGLLVAEAIQENMRRVAEVTIWNQNAFELSKTTIESLIKLLDSSDFSIFVFSPDDILRLKGKKYSAVRDNVLFEVGLFIGRLGRERTFVIVPESPAVDSLKDLRIPTDLLGVTLGTFDSNRQDKNLVSASSPFCSQVKSSVAKLGKLNPDKEAIESSSKNSEPEELPLLTEANVESDWIDFFIDRNFKSALEKINELLAVETDEAKIKELTVYSIHCHLGIKFSSGKIKMDKFLENENNVKTWESVGWSYLSDGYLIQAMEVADKGIDKLGDANELLVLKAEVLDRMGENSKAIELLKSLSSTSDVSLRLANIMEKSDDKENAIEVLRKAHVTNPKSAIINDKLGRLSSELGYNELALYMFSTLSAESPNNSSYLIMLGNVYLELELYDHALQAYQKAEQLADHNHDTSLMNIGNLLKNKALFNEAKSFLKRSILMDNNSSYAYKKLGELITSQEEELKLVEKLKEKGRTQAITDVALGKKNS